MKSDTHYERELRNILTKAGWLVIRSAGSHKWDLTALKPNEHMIIEVKATRSNKYYTTKDKEQHNQLTKYNNQGFNVYYYIRWKGDKKWERWQFPFDVKYPIFIKNEGEDYDTNNQY